MKKTYRLWISYTICLNVFLCSVPVRSVGMNVTAGDHVTVGDVIHCSADTVYPPVTYYWQQYITGSWRPASADGDGSDGSMLELSTAGVKLLRCVAYNTIGNTNYSVTSINVTVYVNAQPGECCFEYFFSVSSGQTILDDMIP